MDKELPSKFWEVDEERTRQVCICLMYKEYQSEGDLAKLKCSCPCR